MYARITSLTLAAAIVASIAAGCATGSKGPSDRELIMSTLNEWKAGLVAKNPDQTIVAYSENFRDGEGRGKADMHAFLKEAVSMGYLDSLMVDLETVQVTINGVDATVSPVALSSSAGSMTLYLVMKKEDETWRIVGSTGS
jgi:hypothetical protein